MNWDSKSDEKMNVCCPHGKQKNGYYCKDCGGKGICPHGKQKSKCVECGGKKMSRRCPHGKQKNGYYCKDCSGWGLCLHGKRKSYCVECGGKKPTPSQKKRKQPGGMEISRQTNKKRRKSNAVPRSTAPVAATVVAAHSFETTIINEFQIMAANKESTNARLANYII